MKVNSKVFVITGAGNGIGRELALVLLEKGARVAAVDIDEKGLQQTLALSGNPGERLSIHVVNITDRAAVDALPQAVIAAHGAVDGVINNAGVIQHFVRFNELPHAEIERMININFYGTINITKAFLPHLLNRPEGHVVNVSSMGGFLPVPGQTLYGASKAAVKLFTEGLYSELLGTHVHVTIVFPGAIATNIAANSGAFPLNSGKLPEKRMKTTPARSAAEQIIKGVERNAFRLTVGGDAKLMDLLARFFPLQATKFIHKQMGALLDQ